MSNKFDTTVFTIGKNKKTKYFLKLCDPRPVPLSKFTSFDAVRRALSNDVCYIVINKTNETFRFPKTSKIRVT
jgi:hypothetical protein